MGYGSPLIASARYETLGAGVGTGTTVTSGAINTKGLYSTLGTTSFQYDGIFLSFSTFSAAFRVRIDIAINTTADTIVVPDLFIDTTGGGGGETSEVFLPVSIPAGAAVKIRSQSNGAAVTFSTILCGYQTNSNGTRGFARCVSLTDWTNTDPTGSLTLSGTTQTGWAEIQASSSARVAALYVAFDSRGTSPASGIDILINFGWGSLGNERSLASIMVRGGGTGRPFSFGPFPCDFPAGTRFVFNAQASGATTSVISLSLLGLAL